MTFPPLSDPAQLASLRSELDSLDDTLHELMVRRAATVAEIGRSGAKGRARFRPGREAAILRRLLAQPQGVLAPATVVVLWREMFAASIALQGPFRMAMVDGDPALKACAHAHFRIPPTCWLDAEASDWPADAHVAVLPWPEPGSDWWRRLGPAAGRYVVARLPFLSTPTATQAAVIAPDPPDPSGDDRSLLLVSEDFDPTAHGFAPLVARTGRDRTLLEVEGFVSVDDPRLRDSRAVLAGAYAVPIHG